MAQLQGAGFADYMILTGIDPYDPLFEDDTRVLFFWSESQNNDGGETVFLSGSVQAGDIEVVPEPATLVLLGTVALGAAFAGQRRKS